MEVPKDKLQNELEIPMLGLGTWKAEVLLQLYLSEPFQSNTTKKQKTIKASACTHQLL